MHAKLRIQCTDNLGRKGDFLTDIETEELVSPTFDDLVAMFKWLKENGWVSQPYDSRWPVGHYKKIQT